ncbi:MAG TPA: CPBP family intramembrane glutamic endopeptidase [Terriglobales bacterium]|jgi:hypothetical protein|nr:CPBP family intramembrane glutamic endopeptidase [Terriglobales bacterium]
MSSLAADIREITLKRNPHSDFIAWVEIFTTWSLIEATIWSVGRIQVRLFWMSAFFIVATTIAHRPKLNEIGLGIRGLRASLWIIPASLVLSSAALLLAWAAGTLHPLFGMIDKAVHSTGYSVWAIFQQFILQSYFFLRLEKLISSRAAVVLSAGLFCVIHVPNPVLVTVCLIAGWCACEIFRRNRNIYALGVAHAILGLTIAVTVPDDIQRHMRVGIGYYRYHSHAVLLPRG